jgi:hypothetical protein
MSPDPRDGRHRVGYSGRPCCPPACWRDQRLAHLASGILSGQCPGSRRAQPEGRDLRCGPASDDSASVGSALAGIVHAGQSFGRATAAGRSPPSPGKPKSPSTPRRRGESRPRRRLTCTSTTSTPTTAASSNGWPASTASPPKICPTTSVGDAPSKPGATNSPRQTGPEAPSETVHTNS